MNANIKPSDRATLLARIVPQSATTAKTSGWVSMALVDSILATVQVGTIATNGTVDAKVQQAKDSSGTGAKDITGKSITQLTEAGADSNKEAEINVLAEDLDVNNGFCFAQLSITPAVAAALIAGTVRGFSARDQPLADASTVDEVVG